jgi:hypothetical protein
MANRLSHQSRLKCRPKIARISETMLAAVAGQPSIDKLDGQ